MDNLKSFITTYTVHWKYQWFFTIKKHKINTLTPTNQNMKEFKGSKNWGVQLGTDDDFARVIIGSKSIKLGFTNVDEDNANARLIAAAPELLEALQLLLYGWNNEDLAHDVTDSFNKARLAVDKALGKETTT